MPTTTAPPVNIFDDDEEGWEEMPVVREDEFSGGLDEEDRKKYHYQPSSKVASAANARGDLLDVDATGLEWRSKQDLNESEYTRLRIREEDEADEVHLRTRYLFDEDKAMTPLSQMQATKNLLTEAQRIAYVGLCALTSAEMAQALRRANQKELKAALTNMDLWAMKIMGRLYYHMELETQEQKMIESLAAHGVRAEDLVPALMTTHTVANPEYDPVQARHKADVLFAAEEDSPTPSTPPPSYEPGPSSTPKPVYQTTSRVLEETSTSSVPGVSTSLSATDEKVTLDIRWTVLCDLFLILIADSVYDARSRVLLENVALKLGLGWLDVVKFESRVTEALEIQEDVEKMGNKDVIEGRAKSARKKRFMMLGLATLGGGLVIGLSAGVLAPVIGLGIGAALGTVGISGTTGFLVGAGGAAMITTGGVLTGSGIAAKGMMNRTQQVRTFDILPLHNNKRVSCILTVPGFLNGALDDPRLPFSVLDPVVGDVFSVIWEPEMIRETGSALKILTGEVLTQIGQSVLQATVMGALMGALQWPIILTKLGYLIDNPWNNALDRARAAGGVLADVLMHRYLGVRPITLIGFSLGARVIFYALLELAKKKAYGVVQDVFLLGATISMSSKSWCQSRSVVSGRYVNAFARNDWVLNYLFRATSGGVGTVAGLRPIEGVPGLENVDVTDKIAGHMSYRTFMPLILDQLGFPVFADYFDEPEEPDFEGDRIVINEEEQAKSGWFGRKKKPSMKSGHISRPPSGKQTWKKNEQLPEPSKDDGLPPREPTPSETSTSTPTSTANVVEGKEPEIPIHAGFDLEAIKDVIASGQHDPEPTVLEEYMSKASPSPSPPARPDSLPIFRSENSLHSMDTIAPHFSRSLTLNDARPRQEAYEETKFSSPLPPKREALAETTQTLPTLSTYQPPPALSFGNGDGSLWSNDTVQQSRTDIGYGTNSWGASSVSLAGNPFAPSIPSAQSEVGLSFGGMDGSITSPAFKLEPDPWAIPNWEKKKTSSGFDTNPW